MSRSPVSAPHRTLSSVLFVAGLPLVAQTLTPSTARAAAVPPVERAERHFEAGVTYLRALPDGTEVTIRRGDGCTFTLRQESGRLTTRLPQAQVSADRRTFTSPLGYRVSVLPAEGELPAALMIRAPGGAISTVTVVRGRDGAGHAIVATKTAGAWSRDMGETFVLRLPDGTRVDSTDQGRRWEAFTLGGERARLEFDTATWTSLPKLPSPPLIPDLESYFVCCSGDTWREPKWEDHVVFAWNWYPVGFSPVDAIEDVRVRRSDLDRFFSKLALAQDPFEMAAYLLARRLALSGGDRVTFRVPGAAPADAFLLPGSVDPPSTGLRVDPSRLVRGGLPPHRRPPN